MYINLRIAEEEASWVNVNEESIKLMNMSISRSSIHVVLKEIVKSQCDESLSPMNDKYNDYICSTVILNSNKIDIIRRQKNKEDIL